MKHYKLSEFNQKLDKYRENSGRVPLGLKKGGYIYIFVNRISNMRYVGKSIDILARLDSYLQKDSQNNKQLVNDIKNNIDSFDIYIKEIIPEAHSLSEKKTLKDYESRLIKKLSKSYDLYNIAENKPRKKDSKKLNITISGIHFTSIKQLKEYNRDLLESYTDEEFITDEKHYRFAYELIQYHPDYKNKIKWGSRLKVQLDNKYPQDSGWGRSKGYKNFRFEIDGEFIQLSSNKCIDNINK